MVTNLYRNSPLRVVYVWKVPIFFGDIFDFLEDLFIVEFGVIPALEIEHPAPDLFVRRVDADELIQLI
jgi:hypothetical protein